MVSFIGDWYTVQFNCINFNKVSFLYHGCKFVAAILLHKLFLFLGLLKSVKHVITIFQYLDRHDMCPADVQPMKSFAVRVFLVIGIGCSMSFKIFCKCIKI